MRPLVTAAYLVHTSMPSAPTWELQAARRILRTALNSTKSLDPQTEVSFGRAIARLDDEIRRRGAD